MNFLVVDIPLADRLVVETSYSSVRLWRKLSGGSGGLVKARTSVLHNQKE
jgi:hypothetical protein